MPVAFDFTGKTFGRLVGIARVPAKGKSRSPRWSFKCTCGTVFSASGRDVKSGKTASCGCLQVELTRARNSTHGKSRSKTYASWGSMISRCSNEKLPTFKHYGGRGISVCPRWTTFENFLADMGPRPVGTTLDRIDNNGNYEPGNCRWATIVEQRNNCRSNHLVTFKHMTRTIADWARVVGIPYFTLHARVSKYGWSAERALTTAVKK